MYTYIISINRLDTTVFVNLTKKNFFLHLSSFIRVIVCVTR